MALRLRIASPASSCSSRRPIISRKPLLAAACYSFASSVPQRERGERPDRAHMKRQENQLRDVVQGLTAMNEKQLHSISHLVNGKILEAVNIASKIKGQNQGRKRQEAFIAKLIRDQLDADALYKLKDAMWVANNSSGTFQDPEIVNLIEVWKEGLMANDQSVTEEVIAALIASGSDVDPQRLRLVSRQAYKGVQENEELIKQQTEAAAAAAEDETAPVAPPIGPKANKALRELHKLLKPVAEYTIKNQEE